GEARGGDERPIDRREGAREAPPDRNFPPPQSEPRSERREDLRRERGRAPLLGPGVEERLARHPPRRPRSRALPAVGRGEKVQEGPHPVPRPRNGREAPGPRTLGAPADRDGGGVLQRQSPPRALREGRVWPHLRLLPWLVRDAEVFRGRGQVQYLLPV